MRKIDLNVITDITKNSSRREVEKVNKKERCLQNTRCVVMLKDDIFTLFWDVFPAWQEVEPFR